MLLILIIFIASANAIDSESDDEGNDFDSSLAAISLDAPLNHHTSTWIAEYVLLTVKPSEDTDFTRYNGANAAHLEFVDCGVGKTVQPHEFVVNQNKRIIMIKILKKSEAYSFVQRYIQPFKHFEEYQENESVEYLAYDEDGLIVRGFAVTLNKLDALHPNTFRFQAIGFVLHQKHVGTAMVRANTRRVCGVVSFIESVEMGSFWAQMFDAEFINELQTFISQ